MKKTLSIILALLFVLSIGAVGVFAATRRSSGKFVDADKNGICDNRGASSAACPNNGERALDGSGKRAGNSCAQKGSGFVDDDGNGVCDNAGNGNGGNYIDANSDGVCDNARAARGQRNACGARCGS